MCVLVCVHACVCVRVLTSSPLICSAVALSTALVSDQLNRMREVKAGGDGRKQEDGRRRGGGALGGWRGAVCHCESAQGGSHHLAIDGCPSPVVKQAPVGLPEHWGHCVSSLTGNIPPKVPLPPPLSNPWHPGQFPLSLPVSILPTRGLM